MWIVFFGEHVILFRFLGEVEPFFINEDKVKKSLNLGSPLNPLSIMSIHHFNLVFLLASVR
jgi:hypothetical protein